MPPRRKLLLLILASCTFPFPNAHFTSEDIDQGWIKRKSFQVLMTWYLKQAHTVTVRLLHGRASNSICLHSSIFLPVIYEQNDTPVIVRHYHLIKPADQQKYDDQCKMNCTDRWNGNNLSLRTRGGNCPQDSNLVIRAENRTEERTADRYYTHSVTDDVAILFIPDDVTLHEFLDIDQMSHAKRTLKLMLIILIPHCDLFCQEVPRRVHWKESLSRLLRRIWLRDKILDIFLYAPTSACIKDHLFAWNPFAAGTNNYSGILKSLKFTEEDAYLDKRLSGFRNTLANMNGYPLRVSIFGRSPTVVTIPDVGLNITPGTDGRVDLSKASGLDSVVLKTMGTWMNCSLELYPPTDGMEYGYRMENGTFVGVIGDIVYRRVDFAANSMFLKDYGTAFATEFTIPITCEAICIVVPRAGAIPQWLQIFRCFSPLVWNVLLLNIIVYSLLRYIARTLLREDYSRRNLLAILIETFRIFLSSPEKMPNQSTERIIIGFFFLMNVIVVGTFQGTLYDGFTNPRHYENMNTLTDLDKSGLPIGTTSPNLRTIFGEDDESPTFAHLYRKVRISTSPETGTIDRAAWSRDIAAIERRNDLMLIINTKFVDEHGEHVLHIIDECPRSYHLTYMVPRDAFFLRRMNHLLRRIFEAGLSVYWYNSTVDLLIMKNHYSMSKKLKPQDKAVPFNLENLQFSFIMLTGGLLLSLFIFMGEMARFRYNVTR